MQLFIRDTITIAFRYDYESSIKIMKNFVIVSFF